MSSRWQNFAAALARYRYALTLTCVGALALACVGSDTCEPNIVRSWNETIERLGVEPVFPPSEDLEVGDILAVIVRDRRDGSKSNTDRALLNRAVKIGHIDMRGALRDSYESSIHLPNTVTRKSNDDPVKAQESSNPLFDPEEKFVRTTPELAAIPGFSIKRERGVGLTAWLRGALDIGSENEDSLVLKIPKPETYGVPAKLAIGLAQEYCRIIYDVCFEDMVREYLSFASPGVYDFNANAKQGEDKYYVEIGLELVNRVYMTRAIDQHSSRIVKNNAKVEIAAQDAKDAGATGPSAKANAHANADDSIDLADTFDRPVVIGYRSVRMPVQASVASRSGEVKSVTEVTDHKSRRHNSEAQKLATADGRAREGDKR